MFKVNVSPDMGMYHLLRNQGYDPAYALAEFIDNAIHAHQSKNLSELLEIDIRFYLADYHDAALRNSIVITDNGSGISKADLSNAMKPAHHAGKAGLSEFGIGMKAAAVWFTDLWELQTTPKSSSNQYHLRFDLTKLLESGSDSVNVTESKALEPSGTSISLMSIRRVIDPEKFKYICNSLKELYQKFTEGTSPKVKLTAHLNDTPVDLKFSSPNRSILYAPIHKKVGGVQYAIGENKAWQVSVDTVFNGRKVEGMVCLLETGSYKDNPGLVLFRHNRVITGTTNNPYIPNELVGTSNKYSRQRVYGEIHMDDMPVTYTKDKFEIDEAAFIATLLENHELGNLMRQAEAYRSRSKEPVTQVASESEIPGKPSNGKQKTKPAPKPNPKSGGNGALKVTTPVKQPIEAAFVSFLRQLQNNTASLGLKNIIQETIGLYQFRRDISTALCMRIVVEQGVLNKLERDHPQEYAKMSDDGIKKILGKLNGSPYAIFDKRRDAKIIKCIQNMATGQQADIIMLNNISHGSYQPIRKEIDALALNLEPILQWAYS